MTVIAYTSEKEQIAGYLRYGLDGVRIGVTQTYFIAELISLDLLSFGVSNADLLRHRTIWIAEITFDEILNNTSKLRSSVQKYTLGYWEVDYWGCISASGYLQYLSQRLPTQTCRLTRDTYVYPSLVQPSVQGEAYGIYALDTQINPTPAATTLHFLLDQVNPIGSTLQIQYLSSQDSAPETPSPYYTTY